MRLYCLHAEPAGESTWKTACAKQNQKIHISFKWDVLWIRNFGLRLKRLIKVKDHTSDDTSDFLSVICYALSWSILNFRKQKQEKNRDNNSILGP